MSKQRRVSESDIHRNKREADVDATAKYFEYVHDCYPRAANCGRCGARKGGCGCGFSPYFGSDALYQLSRMHMQSVSHMVRMGLSTWDILTGGDRCHRCDCENCRCEDDHGCSRCHGSPCRCSKTSAPNVSKDAQEGPVESAVSNQVETVTARLSWDSSSTNYRAHTMLQGKNLSASTVEVDVVVPQFRNDDQRIKLTTYVQFFPKFAEPGRAASAHVYFVLERLTDSKADKTQLNIVPITGIIELTFNKVVVARTKVILEVNHPQVTT